MRCFTIIALAIASQLAVGNPAHAPTPKGRGFSSPGAAAKALIGAAKSDNVQTLIAILGPSSKDLLITSDPVADQQVRRKFVDRAAERMKLIPDPQEPKARTLVVGKDQWPLPIPIVQVNRKWYFDVDQGRQEILTRRIGSDELDAIEVCRGYVEAQNDYAEKDRTGSGALHYAQRIISSPGKRDGLYWPSTSENDQSPIGDVVARAFGEGYTNKNNPYHGYYFKVLTGQGLHASGGRMSYLHNGLMTKGFALIAWPSDYGVTGIMTFLVNKAGIVYQKDLGKTTPEIARAYDAYDPDATWTPVETSAHK
jgi:Protein of unknown function (DUF2950)